MGDLSVELGGELVGHLVQKRNNFDFEAERAAVDSHGLQSLVLSRAVPLLWRSPPADAGLRRNFFAELLPEGDARERLALEAKVRKGDVVAMLRAYGRDVAGALQIWDPELPDEPRTPHIEELDGDGVAEMLDSIPLEPLGNKPRRGKTSLAGLQNKIVLVRTDSGWARALDGYPSTHIVKPVVGKAPSRIFDEEYGARFVRRLGLAPFSTTLERFGPRTALVIERYDRARDAPTGRIHQEDFNQILGLSGDEKYEMYGGKGLKDVAAHLSDEDKVTLLEMMTLSVALGNLDHHAKNISLIHHPDGSTTLAPMYDVVPQTHDSASDGEVSLYIDGVAEHRLITMANLVAEGSAWGVANAEQVVSETLTRTEVIASEEKPHVAAHPGLQSDVLGFARALLDGGPAGGPAARATGTAGGWGWDNRRMPYQPFEG